MERNNLIPDIGITDPRKNNVSDAVWPRNGAEAENLMFSHVLQNTISTILKKTIKEMSLNGLKIFFSFQHSWCSFLMCLFLNITPLN